MVEVISPGDETYDKLPFYAAHALAEVLMADPEERSLQLLALDTGHYATPAEAPSSESNWAALRWP